MATAIFVNLPVSNVQRSSSFFSALGYTINPQFSDDSTACVVFSDTIYAMLLAEARFKDFTPKVVADARTATEAIICLGAASRADVDRIADAAAGQRRQPRPRPSGPRLHVRAQLRRPGRSHLGGHVDGPGRRVW